MYKNVLNSVIVVRRHSYDSIHKLSCCIPIIFNGSKIMH